MVLLIFFARAEPFFATYNFESKHVSVTENAFGSKLSGILAYESMPVSHSGRFTLKGELGAELSFNSKPKVEIKDKTELEKELYDFSLDRRSWGKPFLAFSAGYQF